MPQDFYTYVAEARGGVAAQGSPVTYKYTPNWPPNTQSGGEIVQGEVVGWDQTGRTLVRMLRTGGVPYVGISRDSAVSVQKLGNQTALLLTDMSVMTSGIHQLLGTGGDTYSHGDVVYLVAGSAQSVQKTGLGTGVQIGTVWLPDGSQKVGAVRVPVLIDNYTSTIYGS